MNNFIPAQCFPPGEFLKDELNARKVSVSDFAKIVGMSVQEVSDIIDGELHIGVHEAEKLGSALGVSSAFWANSQMIYDKWVASRPTQP